MTDHVEQGGHFSIHPRVAFSTKQNYLPNSNVRLSSAHTNLTDLCASLTGLANEVRSSAWFEMSTLADVDADS